MLDHTPARLGLAAILCLLSSWTRADLPLTIENLLTAENRRRVEMGLTYAGSDRRNIDARFTTSIRCPCSSMSGIYVTIRYNDINSEESIFLWICGWIWPHRKKSDQPSHYQCHQVIAVTLCPSNSRPTAFPTS